MLGSRTRKSADRGHTKPFRTFVPVGTLVCTVKRAKRSQRFAQVRVWDHGRVQTGLVAFIPFRAKKASTGKRIATSTTVFWPK